MMKILLLGATFSTRNMGSALTAELFKPPCSTIPAPKYLLDYERKAQRMNCR
jgi:hypothetical protein